MNPDEYFDLGRWRRRITTNVPEAQRWFDRGLNWNYAFNQEEAVVCFRKAIEADPSCAMAYWGVAHAAGPFYNRPWIRHSPEEIERTLTICHDAAQSALELAPRCTKVERALIEAIGARYQAPPPAGLELLSKWQADYAEAMRDVHRAFPRDLDVTALYTEAAITRTPRQLWDLNTGAPMPGADTVAVQASLESVLQEGSDPDGTIHPGVLHIYIHLMEMSPFPERALIAADRLCDLAPDAGHMQHMPAHIYVLCGDYAQAIEMSRKAIEADDKYLAYAGADNFYTTARCHDLHLLMHAAMLIGQHGTAQYAARRIREFATPELIAGSPDFMASILDGYMAMTTHVPVRFGKWLELIADPAPAAPRLFPLATAMNLYGRGVAHAALGQVKEAERARAEFREAAARVPANAVFLSNLSRDILAVGEAMLDGELEYRKGNHDDAYASLRTAVDRDDRLNYTEPWAWMHPPRHALGALLAEQGHFAEAEEVYRTDLGHDPSLPRCCQHPENVWALHGLLECVERRNDAAEAAPLRQRLTYAQARADVSVTASCCCRASATGHAGSA